MARKYSKEKKEWELWRDWYVSNVIKKHSHRFTEHNSQQIACNLLRYSAAQLVVREMTNYVFSEADFGEYSKYIDEKEMSLIFADAQVYGQNLLLVLKGEDEKEKPEITMHTRCNYSIKDECVKIDLEHGYNYQIKKEYEEVEIEVIRYDERTDAEVIETEVVAKETGRYVIELHRKGNVTYTKQIVDYCPYFIFKTNVDIEYPGGAAIYAYALDKLESIDKLFTHMLNEIELTQSMVVVANTALGKDIVPPTPEELEKNPNAKAKYEQFLDKNNRVFKVIMTPEGEQEKVVLQEIQMDLRSDDFINLFNFFLFGLGKACGFGNVFFRYDNTGEVTATGVVNSKHELWKNIVAYREDVKDYLVEIMEVITGVEVDRNIFKFGDGLITDEEALFEKGLKLLDKEVISQTHFLIKYAGYSEQEVKEIMLERVEELGMLLSDPSTITKTPEKVEATEPEEPEVKEE